MSLDHRTVKHSKQKVDSNIENVARYYRAIMEKAHYARPGTQAHKNLKREIEILEEYMKLVKTGQMNSAQRQKLEAFERSLKRLKLRLEM